MGIKTKVRMKIPTRTVMRDVERKLEPNLAKAASFMGGVARAMVGVPYPPASVEGMPPHMRTGKLRVGITSRKQKKTKYLVVASAVKRGFDYASALEFGWNGGKHKRPFMRPMMLKTYRAINTYFKGAF